MVGVHVLAGLVASVRYVRFNDDVVQLGDTLKLREPALQQVHFISEHERIDDHVLQNQISRPTSTAETRKNGQNSTGGCGEDQFQLTPTAPCAG